MFNSISTNYSNNILKHKLTLAPSRQSTFMVQRKPLTQFTPLFSVINFQ